MRVMSIETFDRFEGKIELSKLLDEGLTDVKEGRVIPAEKTFKQIEDNFK